MKRRLSAREWILLSIATLLFSAVSAQSLGLFGNQDSPTVIAPCGAPLVLLAFLFGPLSPVMMAVCFFVVEGGLMTTARVATKWTALAAGIIGALSIWYFASSWQWGVEYEDRQYGNPHYTLRTAILSAAFGAVLFVLLFCVRRQKSTWSQLLVHLVFAAWVVTYAFPYLGELL
jgi:hypothetical protein